MAGIAVPSALLALGLAFASGLSAAALWSLAGFAAGLVVMSVLAFHFLVNARLRRLALVMKRAGEGDMLVRAVAQGQDEIGQLAVAFNRLLGTMTALKAEELEATRTLAMAQEELALKEALEQSAKKLEARVNQLSILYDVARSLTSTLEVDELLRRISGLVKNRLDIKRFSLMLVNSSGDLEIRVALPGGPDQDGLVFALGEGACGLAAQTQKAVYIPDVSRDASIFVTRSGPRLSGSLLAVPIIAQEQVLGVLNLERSEVAGFDAAELELLGAVADQVAIGIRNARLHEETVALSITDALTDVPNRRHLFSRLDIELARAQRYGTQVSFIMVDIDHFKKLNDAVGHRAGDSTLREVADLLKGQVRKLDTLARYGGEEFALVLPQVGKAEALEVAEKLRRAVADHVFAFGDVQPGGRVTLSVGLASLPGDAVTLEALVDAADSALYASKRGGRNVVTAYEPGMELHPGRERGLHRTTSSGEVVAVILAEEDPDAPSSS